MTKPIRIQRKRTKGWRMPEGAIYVGRGTPWGNPFIMGQPCGIFPEGKGHQGKAEVLIPVLNRALVIELYRELIEGVVRPEMYPYGHRWNDNFRRKFRMHPCEAARSFLAGHNLACWCDPEGACHADLLLELANIQ